MIRNNFYRNSSFGIWRVLPYGLIALVFAISRPLAAAESSHKVCLRNAVIDTAPTVASFQKTRNASDKFSADAAALLSSGRESKTVDLIIQFTGPIQEEWKKLITVYGDARTYIPDNALLVRTTADRLHSLAALEPVQWIGVLKPEYKIQPGLLSTVPDIGGSRKPPIPLGSGATNASATTGGAIPDPDGSRVVRIRLFAAEDTDGVAAAIRQMDGEVMGVARGPRQGTIRARMRREAIAALAGLPEVEWIERFRQPKILNNVSAGPARMNANIVQTNFGLTGHGQVIAVCDTGLDTGDTNTLHPDFTNRVHATFGWARPGEWSDLMGHGTHCAGSVLGNGSAWSNGLYKGMSYEAELVFQSCGDASDNIYLPDDLNEVFIQAYTNDARIHSDSWGSDSAGEYSIECQQSDEFIWDHPEMLIVFAAGNEGVDTDGDGVVDLRSVGTPASAKNVLAVGAAISDRAPGSGGYSSYIWGTAWGSSYFTPPLREGHVSQPWDGVHQGMAAFSSRGPCQDGRVKPDIVAPGTDIISCRSRMSTASTLWGTGEGVLANAASNYYTFCGGTSMATPLTAGAAGLVRQYLVETRGLANPSAALIKALMAAGARSLAPGQYGLRTREIPFGSRPNVVEGWGHVDLGNTLFPDNGTNILVNGDTLATGAMKTYRVTSSGTNRLAIVLAWSDYPASPLAAASLVNDLDLQVVAPDGTIYYPNGLHGPDRTNNVEGMDIFPTQTGTYEIMVQGWNVPQGPQPFALVIHEARSAASQAIDGLWHEPAPVTNGAGISVKATIIPDAAGLAAVSNIYRVNGGAWTAQDMVLTNSAGGQLTYAADLPALQGGDRVEYFARACSRDSVESVSGTNAFTVWGEAFYVSPQGAVQPPYDTLERAFTNIMAAVRLADPGMMIRVDQGTYRETVTITNPLTMSSLDGAGNTIIDGEGSRFCMAISANALVDGFTLTRGHAADEAAGVDMLGGEIRNCIISNNFSAQSVGGVAIMNGGWVRDSIICNNTGIDGGGVAMLSGGQCNNCRIINNTAVSNGGGVVMALGGTLSNCVIQGNSAGETCGGVMMANFFSFSTVARNCLITDNIAPTSAAVVIEGGGILENCTIAGNQGQASGALYCLMLGMIYNTIIYGNSPSNCALDPGFLAILLQNCCTVPALENDGHQQIVNQVVANPKFRHAAAGDYRLCANSPCRDAGTNMDWMTGAVDLEGHARIINNIVDIGAYELPLPRDMWNFAAVRNAFADYDGDGLMDPAVYNPITGLWLVSLSGQGYQQVVSQLGGTGYTAVPGDYNGARRTELAVYQEAAGLWMLQGNPAMSAALGGPGWWPVPGDYDGDEKTDPSVYYSNGECRALLSACGYGSAELFMNMAGARPVFGDFDGDDRLDPAMYLETSGLWAAAMSGAGYVLATAMHGGSGWIPAAADYDGDGRADPAVYQEASGIWYALLSNQDYAPVLTKAGGPGYVPVPGDYDGDGLADPAVYNNSTGVWIASCSHYGYQPATLNLGGPEYIAVNADR